MMHGQRRQRGQVADEGGTVGVCGATGGTTIEGIVEKLVSGSRWRLRQGKGKSRLVKNNMARNEDALSGKVHAAMALMMR
jgi:hypothetical protein